MDGTFKSRDQLAFKQKNKKNLENIPDIFTRDKMKDCVILQERNLELSYKDMGPSQKFSEVQRHSQAFQCKHYDRNLHQTEFLRLQESSL